MHKPIRFRPEIPGGFYDTLRRRAEDYFSEKSLSKTGAWQIYVKGLFVLIAYIGAYAAIYRSESPIGWYALLGFLTVPLILNIGHEAVHGTFSPYPRLNRTLAYVFNLAGADGAIWRYRHVQSHHVFPNILGHDLDIAQNKLARIAPGADYLPAHRFQHWYMPGLYLIYTLNWLIFRDFKDFSDIFGKSPQRSRRFAFLLISKIFYFGYVLVLPLLFLPEKTGEVWLGFFIMQFVMSATTFLVLASAHVGEDAVFPQPDEQGHVAHTWAAHQLITTTDFAPDSWLVTQLFGGFNHHVAHHLFPEISHVHYPALTRLTRTTAAEFGLAYHCFPSVQASVLSHFRLLKKHSFAPLMFEHGEL
jgi:linoleoyl-CoA desaturase